MTAPFKQGLLVLSGTYTEPAFRLSQESHSMQQALFRSLQPFGLAVENIQEGGAYAGPSAWSLSLRFLRFLAQLVVTVQRYELTLNIQTLDSVGDFNELLAAIEQTVHRQIEPATLGTREIVFHMHYENPTFKVEDRFGIRAAESLGTASGTSVGLRLKDSLFGNEAVVSFEKSIVYEGAVFTSIRSTLDAGNFNIEQVSGSLKSFVEKIAAFIEQE